MTKYQIICCKLFVGLIQLIFLYFCKKLISKFRFCTHDYYPFNAEDTEKYVVGDDYIPISDVSLLF